MSNVNTLQMYKAIVSLESEVDQLKQITTINNDNSDLNNYYTKSEIDDKLDDISDANLSNYVQFGENSTDEGIILMGKTHSRFKTTLNQQSLEITDGSVTTNISNSGINCTNKNNDNFTITLDSTNNIAKLEIDGSMNISVGSSTLAITESDVTFKGQSLLGGDDNYIINGENGGNVEIATNNTGSVSVTSGTGGINLSSEGGSVNIASVSSGEINLTSQGSTLAITQDDVTFKGSSLLSGVSGNYVVNGENTNGVNITTNNTNNISLSAEGTGEINLSSKYRINLRANTSRFVVTPDDVTFNDSSFIVNGTNNKNINIKTGDGNSITIEDGNDNIIDFASMHGIKLTSGGSTLNITSDDVMFKNRSLIVDTSNFIINGANNKAINISTDTNNINLTSGGSSLIISSSNVNTTSHSINIKASSGGGGAGINLTSGSSTLKIMFNDVTYKGQSLIVDTSNFIINGDNGHNNDVNITGKTINLKASGDAVLAITSTDVTFRDQSLIVDTSNFIVNGTNNNDIDITTGIGYIKLSSDNSINLSVNNSTLAITSTDVTFKGQSLINNGGGGTGGGNYVVNGNNSGAVNITAAASENINITSQGGSSVNITTGSYGFHVNAMNEVNLSVGTSTLAITSTDVTFRDQSLIVDTSMFIVNGTNNGAVNIDVVGDNGINMKAESGSSNRGIKLTAGTSTLAITDTDITFKDQSLILNGQNNGELNINTSGNYINIYADSGQHGSYGINLTAGSSTLTITSTDVTFKGQSLINNGGSGSGGNYVVNGVNNGAVDIDVVGDNGINLTSGGSTLKIMEDGVTFNDRFLILNGNNDEVDITTVGNYINITARSNGIGDNGIKLMVSDSTLSMHGNEFTYNGDSFTVGCINNINLSVNSSTLAITSDDVTYKGQSLIIDTSNFVINGTNNGVVNITTGSGDNINFTVGGNTLAISDTDVTYNYNSLIINGNNNKHINIQAGTGNNATLSGGSNNSISLTNENTNIVIKAGESYMNISNRDVTYKGQSLINPSATITHKAPIDESLTQDNFELGKPVYMTGNVYVKDKSGETGWKHSESIDDVIDCISSVKHTGTWREYLGICVGKYKTRVGLEENEITFASHGDFMVKYSKCNVGDTLYVTDDGNINVLNDETPLTLKIQRQIVGLVTEKINDEYCAVFKSN